jgi:hypothetical protein
LSKLHAIFQAAMGWTNSHLHSFAVANQIYGMHFDDYPEDEIDEKSVTVREAIGGHRRFSYAYDFGDGWKHEVVIEEATTASRGLRFGVCLDGQNAGPPEDCGGPPGYAELLHVLDDPTHEDYDHRVQWVGGRFDPTAFDLAVTNAALQHLR